MTQPQTLTPAQLAEILTNLPPDSTIELRKSSTGEIAVSYDTPKTKAQIIAADPELRALQGQPITVTEAVERYGVPSRTLLNWKDSQFLTVLADDGYRLHLDEADVAYCVGVYRQRKASGLGFRGAPLLNEHGAPYQLLQPKLAHYRRRRRDLQKKAESGV